MAAKILANLIVMGSGMLARAFVQAYRQAIENASKSVIAQEAVKNAVRGTKIITQQEARQILGVTEKPPWEEGVMQAEIGHVVREKRTKRPKECLESKNQKPAD